MAKIGITLQNMLWWATMSPHEPPWAIMSHKWASYHEPPWVTRSPHEPQELPWTPWATMSHHELPWTLMSHHEPPWALMRCHEPSWATMSHHEPSWATMSHHELPWATKLISILKHDWSLPVTSFQMLNSNQSWYRKVGLLIIKVPKAPLHHVPRYHEPLKEINKLTLKSQQYYWY